MTEKLETRVRVHQWTIWFEECSASYLHLHFVQLRMVLVIIWLELWEAIRPHCKAASRTQNSVSLPVEFLNGVEPMSS